MYVYSGGRKKGNMEDDDQKPTHLPMDIIVKLPAHISDPATLARAASSYKPWRTTIKDPAFLAGLARRPRLHPVPPPRLLLPGAQRGSLAPVAARGGHDPVPGAEPHTHLGARPVPPWQQRRQQRRRLQHGGSGVPRCVSSGYRCRPQLLPARRLPGQLPGSLPWPVDVRLQPRVRRPVSAPGPSRTNAAAALRLARLRRRSPPHRPLWACVVSILPAALHLEQRDRNKPIYRYYCSIYKEWMLPMGVHEVMPGHYLMSSPVAAGGSAMHWLCGSYKSMRPVSLCTINMGKEDLVYVDLPPVAKSNNKQTPPLLASSADGAALLLLVRGLQMSLWKHRNDSSNSDWVRSETIDLTSFTLLPPRVKMMRHKAKLRPESFHGKSGAVVIWMDGEGLFLLSLGDRSLRKIDNVNLAKKYSYFLPYEIDWLSCLAVTNLLIADGSSLHEGRSKIHSRWKTLVAECTK